VSTPRDPRGGLPPEFDPRRGSGRPPQGRPPQGRPPQGRPPQGPAPQGRPPQGYPGADRPGQGGYGGGGPGGRPPGPRGGGPGLPPELDPRGRAGGYSPYGLGGYDTPPPDRPPAPPPGRTRRHSPLVSALRVSGAFLSVLVLVASGILWFLYRDFSTKVDRVDAIGSTVDDVDGKDMNILLVGSDDRTNATPAELQELNTTSQVTNSTDTMILVHIPADGRKATAVSFPRDSWVTIPGCGQHKLNSAYINGATNCNTAPANADRGRQKLVQTISELSGVHIDHYVEVDLLGFYRISKAVGGVEVCLTKAQKEPDSGIDLPAGKSTIEGKTALAFVRQRKELPRGDLDRIVRQQYFISAMFRKVTSLGVLTNPIKLKRLLDAVGSSMRMDDSLDPLQLAAQLRGLAAGNVTFTTIPTEGIGTRGNGQSVVLVDEAAIPPFFTALINPPKPKAPVKAAAKADTTVTVYNGSGRGGLAATAAGQLKAAGFQVAGTGNADRKDYARSEIRYGADGEAQARAVLAVVPGAKLVQQSGVSGGVQLVLGRDFTAVGAKAPATTKAPAATPSGSSRTAADAGCIN
jgi:LCP family protein required for cell wall assembly